MKRRPIKKGFTLIELIVVIAIFTIVMGAVSSFFIYQNKIFFKSSDKFDVQSSLRVSLQTISKEIRNAESMMLMDRTDAQNEMALLTASDYIIIDSDGSVKIYEYVDTPSVGYDVRSLDGNIIDDIGLSYFERIDDLTIGVTLTAQVKAENYSLNTNVLLNNYKLRGDVLSLFGNEMALKFTK